MNIKNINWISEDASEAIVSVVDNKNFSLNCFCQPCKYYLNNEIPVDIKEKEFIEFTCTRIDLY